MEEFETTTRKTRSWGPVAALVALVLVIVVAFVAYGALANASGQSDATTSSAASSATGGTDAGSSRAAASEASDGSASADTDALWLADYDVTVYTEVEDAFTFTQIADGKPLVINFWATWCPYCVQEMDDFQGIYDDYKDCVNFAFVDCVDGTRETVRDGANWLAENGYDLPAYYDTKQDAQFTLGIYSLPTTMVVSADGEILTISAGRISDDLMREALDSLLQG